MRHRHSGLSTYGLNGLRLEDEQPAYTLMGLTHFTFKLPGMQVTRPRPLLEPFL